MLKFQASNFGNQNTSTNYELLDSVNIRDFSARHCAKEFSHIFNLYNMFTVEETEAYRRWVS